MISESAEFGVSRVVETTGRQRRTRIKDRIVAIESVGARGTAVWGLNQFRQGALVSLLNDLASVRESGLAGDQCKEVEQALERVVNVSTQIPDGSFFRKSVYQHLEKFLALYNKWNNPGDASDPIGHRQRFLKKLRKRRHRLARTIRRNQHVLNRELDLKLLEKIYASLGGLATSLPEIFKDLAKTVKNFSKKSGWPIT